MESVARELHVALPALSFPARVIIDALAVSGGRISSATTFAISCGLQSRHQLAGLLRRDGLPQIEELTGWITVLTLVRQRDVLGWSLYRGALQVSKWPPNCYRTVKRLTGTTWRRTCEDGFDRLLDRFVCRCRDLRLANESRKTALRAALAVGWGGARWRQSREWDRVGNVDGHVTNGRRSG